MVVTGGIRAQQDLDLGKRLPQIPPEPSMNLPLRAEVVWSVSARASTGYGLRFLS